MGAWGSGSFENDDALDYAGEIATVADLERALVVAGTEYVEVTEACQVVVAAECVAAMRGYPSDGMPAELAERVHGFGKPSMELFDKARDNLSAVISRSELGDLWAEADPADRAAYNVAMTDLMERLGKPAKTSRKPAKAAKRPAFNHSPCSFCGEPMGEVEASMFDITVAADDISSMRLGGWAHIKCLNAALHPRHLIQNWEMDDELLDFVMKKLEAGTEEPGD